MTTLCPECGTALEKAEGIGEICPYEDCPVIDDANLWDGKGNRAEGPKIQLASDKRFPMQDGPDLPWPMAEKIYAVYVDLYGNEQSMERMAERGGFSWAEVPHLSKRYKRKHRCPPDWEWT